MKIILLLVYLYQIFKTTEAEGFRIVSSYTKYSEKFPPEKINWNIYTHIHAGKPIVFPNGTAICNKSNTLIQQIIKTGHDNNRIIQWGSGFDIYNYVFATNNVSIKNNYLNSINQATEDCNIDGIVVDYEYAKDSLGKFGIVSLKMAKLYTQFLVDLKSKLGTKIVSADIGIRLGES